MSFFRAGIIFQAGITGPQEEENPAAAFNESTTLI